MWAGISTFVILPLIVVTLIILLSIRDKEVNIVTVITLYVVMIFSLIFVVYHSHEYLIKDLDKDTEENIKIFNEDEQQIYDYLDVPRELVLVKKQLFNDRVYDVTYDGDNYTVVIRDNKIAKFVKL